MDGTTVELSEADVLVSTRQKPGFCAASDAGVTVVLNTEMTEELLEEGTVRELVSKIQTLRREANFEVTDHILLAVEGDAAIHAAFDKHRQEILADVLADGILSGPGEITREWDVNGAKAVSYTHLDVYKRQMGRSSARGAAADTMMKGRPPPGTSSSKTAF